MKALTTIGQWDRRAGGTRPIPDRGNETTRILAPFFKGQQGGSFIEMGCGNSVIMPYVARTWGYSVWGIDYSAPRLQQAQRNLAQSGVIGQLVQADFTFAVPANLRGRFDVVYSAGVIEHFSEPSDIVRQMAHYLKPGGSMLTTVPNLAGFWGRLDRRLNPQPGYLPMGIRDLEMAHIQAGLSIQASQYFRWCDPSVLNVSRLPLRRCIYGAILCAKAILNLLPRYGVDLYSDMMVVAQK